MEPCWLSLQGGAEGSLGVFCPWVLTGDGHRGNSAEAECRSRGWDSELKSLCSAKQTWEGPKNCRRAAGPLRMDRNRRKDGDQGRAEQEGSPLLAAPNSVSAADTHNFPDGEICCWLLGFLSFVGCSPSLHTPQRNPGHCPQLCR